MRPVAIFILVALCFTLLLPYADAQSVSLSLSDAIDRGLKYNLAVLAGTQDERIAASLRLRALYELYPKVQAHFASVQQQINLAAFGFTGFAGVPQIIGPFALIDARATLEQSVFDRKLVHDLRAAAATEKAISFGNENTREIVVLTVANMYLQNLAGASRIESVEAQVTRAKTLYDRAVDLKRSGLVAGIDELRAQVELQMQQQRLLALKNDYSIQKLNLARAIGIPLGQTVVLTDTMPSGTLPGTTLESALQTALENRPDIKRAAALLQSASHAVDAARSESRPTVDFFADYGVLGRTFGSNHGTYSMRGQLNVPLFNTEHSKSDFQAASARLAQRRLDLDDLKAQVELDVRSTFLDLGSSEEQLRVAQSSLELARRQLEQAQDRFEAGVANNLEVVQAQESVALADEVVISSLYSLNVAKANIARAMGSAEKTIKTFLGGRQ